MELFAKNSNRPGVYRERVDVSAHQFGGGSIDHSMSLYLRDPVERGRGDGHVEMATFARAGVPGVLRAVVTDFERDGLQALQGRTQSIDARRCVHEGLSLVKAPRMTHNTIASVTTIATMGAMTTLKRTQSASLRLSAIQIFTPPSTM